MAARFTGLDKTFYRLPAAKAIADWRHYNILQRHSFLLGQQSFPRAGHLNHRPFPGVPVFPVPRRRPMSELPADDLASARQAWLEDDSWKINSKKRQTETKA